MHKAYKYRLYPTEAQKVLLGKHFGACRFVYNLALETNQMAYSGNKIRLSGYDLQKQLTDLKKDLPWLKEVDCECLRKSIIHMHNALIKFYKGQALFPKFKSKNKSRCSYTNSVGGQVKISDGKLYQNKFREGIRVVIDRPHEGKIKSTTISKTATGKYFVSVLCETGIAEPIKAEIRPQTTVGIDLGLSHFIITSEGVKIENPKFLKNSIERLAVLQRRASRKKKDSSNRKKANYKVALLHERITNQRKDFLHNLSSKIIRENQTVCVEDLNVAGMVKNHNLARSISDASWAEFVTMLEYRANWYGKNFLQIGRFEPSSKTCSSCGFINKDLKLSEREWTCICGAAHDRDINAAINIKQIALKNSGVGSPGEPVEARTLVRPAKQEVDLKHTILEHGN